MRVSKDRLNQIKKKYNVDTLWSWSRINSFHSDPYSYYLNYVLHKPQTIKDSIYGFEGGECHDIIERFYNNEIKYEDMIGEYEKVLLDIESKKLKYNKTDADKNKAEGEAMDISHGIPFARPMKIYAGDYDDVADAAIIIILSL